MKTAFSAAQYAQSIIYISQNWDQSPEWKEQFHQHAKKWLSHVAWELGLKKGEFDIRSNKGGPAVLGEVILHTDNLYVCLGGSYWSREFMYRSCKGRQDYRGGKNCWMPYSDITNMDLVVVRFLTPK